LYGKNITLIISIVFQAAAVAGHVHDRAFYEEKFFNWLRHHEIKPASGLHFVQMLKNFADNEDYINAHNDKGKSYKLGHNKFSGMSYAEWREHVHLGIAKDEHTPAPLTHAAPASLKDVPDSIDWTTKGAVTGVKDQGQCGSCWSFSTTGAMEGAYYNKYNELKSFSEQNFVDCDNRKGDPKGKDMGCNGGLMDNAFDWAGKNGGVCTEEDYPYTSGKTKKAGDCKQSSCTKVAQVAPKSHTDVQKNSDAAMMSALAQQPVSIAIQADQKDFQLYKSGVFTAECGTKLDHGVLAVGYGSKDGQDYYKVKNSWGTTWGDNGFILLARGGSMQKEGQCGMLSGPPSYPNL
jgi:C1A family cysteine protease